MSQSYYTIMTQVYIGYLLNCYLYVCLVITDHLSHVITNHLSHNSGLNNKETNYVSRSMSRSRSRSTQIREAVNAQNTSIPDVGLTRNMKLLG